MIHVTYYDSYAGIRNLKRKILTVCVQSKMLRNIQKKINIFKLQEIMPKWNTEVITEC